MMENAESDEFKVLREIAKHAETATTSHALGQHLIKHGLRNNDGSPTPKADADNWTQMYQLEYGRFAYKWNCRKVLDLCAKFPPPERGRRSRRK